MSAYVISDVEIRDPALYQHFMQGLKPARLVSVQGLDALVS